MKNVCRNESVENKSRKGRFGSVLIFLFIFVGCVGGAYLAYIIASLPRSDCPLQLEGLVLAHRGADEARTYPENTLAAIRHVHGQGADGIEVDVQLTKDGHMVLMHDLTLEKVTGDPRRVDEVSLQEVQQLRVKHVGEGVHRIPTLEEALDLCEELGLVMNIELKKVQDPIALAEKIAMLFEEKDLYHRAFVSSFLWDHLYQVRKRSGKITSVWITEEEPIYLNPKNILYRVTALNLMPGFLGVDGIFFHTSMLKGRLQRAVEARRSGYQVGTWTLNEPEDVKRLAQISKLIITDRVGSIKV